MRSFPYTVTGPIGARGTLGLIVLQSDETIEHDFRRLLPWEGVSLMVSRVPSGLEVTGESLGAMEAALPAAAGLFPRGSEFDVVGYGCTSGTAVIGPERISDLIRSRCRTPLVSEPVTALVAACSALGVRRLAFLSPYVEAVSATLRGVLSARSVLTPVFGSFNEAREARVARISPRAVINAALALGRSDEVDAIFLSCTNLRSLDVIGEIEKKTGKPTLSSNQVLAWHMMKLAQVPCRRSDSGRLFTLD